MHYRPEIDGLRAVAVMPVILFHTGISPFGGGFIGVDVFFVISGYLITSLIRADLEQGTFQLTEFYERRARRILPALFLVTIVSSVWASLWLIPTHMQEFSESLIAVLTFVSNIFFWSQSGYFAIDAEMKPLLHTWSLAVEEQYYILFPIFLLFVWRYGKRHLLGLLATIGLASLALAHWGADNMPSATFYLLPTRGWEIILGGLCSFVIDSRGKNALSDGMGQIVGLVGMGFIILAIIFFNKNTPTPSLWTLLPTIGAAFLVLNTNDKSLSSRFLSHPLLVGIGRISYSAYLWHFPLFVFARHMGASSPTPFLYGSLIVVTFGLSILTWKFIETPFRDRQWLTRGTIFSSSAMLALFLILIGWSGHVTKGFPSRIHFEEGKYAGDMGHEAFFNHLMGNYYACQNQKIANDAPTWQASKRCWQSKNQEEVDVAIIGDSHAEHLFIGMAEELNSQNVAYYIQVAPAFRNTPKFKNIFDVVTNNPHLQTVVLAMAWDNRMPEISNGTTFEKELFDTIDFLVKSGKKIVLVGEVPRFRFEPSRCFITLPFKQSHSCKLDSEYLDDREVGYLPALEKASQVFSGVKFISLRELFCAYDSCNMIREGKILFRDSNHLNILGSRYAGSHLTRSAMEFFSD